MVSMKSFADKLAQFLQQSTEWNAYSLAMAAGIDKTTIRKIIENRRNPRYDTIEKICAALKITLEDFMADEGIALDESSQHIRNLLSQLSPEERRLLIVYGEGLRDGRGTKRKEPPQD